MNTFKKEYLTKLMLLNTVPNFVLTYYPYGPKTNSELLYIGNTQSIIMKISGIGKMILQSD